MSFHETIEAQKKANQLNQDFENKTGEGYIKAKEDKLGFYGEFKKPEKNVYDPNKVIEDTKLPDLSDTGIENIQIPKDNISEKLSEYLDPANQETENWGDNVTDINVGENGNSESFKQNSKYEHILKRLVESNQISKESYYIAIGSDLEKNNISNLDFQNKEEQKIIEGYINNTKESLNNKNYNLIKFQNDIKEISKIPELESFDFSIESNSFENEALNMVGKNYLKFPDKQGNYDKAKDLQTAILTTRNEILRYFTNIPLDSETYKVAIKNINSGDLKKQMQGIDSLYSLAASRVGELKSGLDKYKNKRKKELIDEFYKLNKEFDALELQKTTQEANKRKKEINERITEIGNEANEIEAGDIFHVGDLDKNSSEAEK